MTAKLNQILAVEKGTKPKALKDVTEIYQIVQKEDFFKGFEKNFQPVNEDAEGAEYLPPESKKVQLTVEALLKNLTKAASPLYAVTARKDWANTAARADVVVDGATLIRDVPVTYLLFLEKSLTDLRTILSKLPVLDEAEDWERDVNSGLYKTKPTKTHRTKKTQRPIVLAPATDKHPAQTQLITEDVISGYWHGLKTSGALPKPLKEKLLERMEVIFTAVKEAREAANMTEEVETPDVAGAIFGYVLKEFH